MEIKSQIVCTKASETLIEFDIVDGFFKGVQYSVTIDPNDLSSVDYSVKNPEFVAELAMKALEGVIKTDITSRINRQLDELEKGD